MVEQNTRCAILCRVSTEEQKLDRQLDECRDYAEQHGYVVSKVYCEKISGSKAVTEREALSAMVTDAMAHRFSVLIVLSLSRLGRSVQTVLQTVNVLTHHQVQIISLKEQLNTTTPMGMFVLTVLSALNALSLDVGRERTKSGIAAYRRRHDGQWGRKPKEWDRDRATQLHAQNMSIRSIARSCGVSVGLVHKFLTSLPVHNTSLISTS